MVCGRFGMVTANAKLFMYNEITEKNRESFHFHGNTGDHPLGSIIFVPKDDKSLTILRGRFASGSMGELGSSSKVYSRTSLILVVIPLSPSMSRSYSRRRIRILIDWL